MGKIIDIINEGENEVSIVLRDGESSVVLSKDEAVEIALNILGNLAQPCSPFEPGCSIVLSKDLDPKKPNYEMFLGNNFRFNKVSRSFTASESDLVMLIMEVSREVAEWRKFVMKIY